MIAEVQLWGRTIGAVSLEEGGTVARFQYDPDFAGSGIDDQLVSRNPQSLLSGSFNGAKADVAISACGRTQTPRIVISDLLDRT